MDESLDISDRLLFVYSNFDVLKDNLQEIREYLNHEDVFSFIELLKNKKQRFQYTQEDNETLEGLENYDIKRYNKRVLSEYYMNRSLVITTTDGIERIENMDETSFDHVFIKDKDIVIIGIYDGIFEDGKFCSSYVSKELPKIIIKHLNRNRGIKDILITSFKELTNNIKSSNKNIRDKFLYSATTVQICVIIEDKIFIANLGNSDVLLLNDRLKISMTNQHNLENDSELRRVLLEDIDVINKNGELFSVGSKNNLRVTRAIGYFEDKYILQEPSIFEYKIVNEETKLCMFTDGVVDSLKYSEIFNLMSSNKDIKDINEHLVKKSIEKGSKDSIVSILIDVSKLKDIIDDQQFDDVFYDMLIKIFD